MLLKLTHKGYSKLPKGQTKLKKIVCEGCTIKTSNKIKQNCAKNASKLKKFI